MCRLTFSKTVFISVIATSVFCTKSSSAFSTSSLACSCLAGLAFFSLYASSILCIVNRKRGKD